VSLNILPEALPIPEVGRLDVPHVELEDTFRGGGALEGRVRTLLLSQLHRGSQGSVIDGLKDLLVELSGLGGLEGHAKSKESIGKTLDTKTDGSVTHVAVASLLHRVVVDIDDLVQVADNNLTDLMQLLEVVASLIVVDEGRQSKGGKVTNSDLIRGTVLDDLSAQVRASDGTEVLLVALAVAGILVKHEGVSGLGLGLEDSIPKLLSLDGLATLTFPLVLLVEGLKLFAVAVSKTRALVGTHEGPLSVLFNTLHEKIRDPEGQEQVAGADLLLTVVLSEIKELEDISVPRLKVDGKSTRSLVTTLVDVAGSVVEDTKHRNNTVGCTVGTSNVGASGTDSVDVETNTTSHLGDHSTGLEGIIDTVNAVLLHINQEA
jgi:hypothetical protein